MGGCGLSTPWHDSPLHCLAWVSVVFLPRQAACRFPRHVASRQGPRQSRGPFPGRPCAASGFLWVSVSLPLSSCLPHLSGRFLFSSVPILLPLSPRLSSFVIWVPPCLCFSVSLDFISESLSGISHSPHPSAPTGRHSPQPLGSWFFQRVSPPAPGCAPAAPALRALS